GSGYLANTGVVSTLAQEGDVVFSDELNHASIVDGCRLARAETFVYDHCDPDHLEWGLREAAGRGALIVTDGVFSMDGDIAPLELRCAQPGRFDKLHLKAGAMRAALAAEGLATGDAETHILPLVVGDASAAMRACERALSQGVFCQGIRPATVPHGSSRLRI